MFPIFSYIMVLRRDIGKWMGRVGVEREGERTHIKNCIVLFKGGGTRNVYAQKIIVVNTLKKH